MRIAELTSIYIPVPPPTHGGTERIVHLVTEGLAARGHAVELWASGDSRVSVPLHSVVPRATLDDPGVTVYLDKELETRNTESLYREADRFDVVHAHWPTLAAYFSSATSTPTVITYAYMEPALHAYYRKHFPRVTGVCVSRAQASLLGDPGLPVVHNGIEGERIPFVAAPEDRVVLVGRMTPNKGIAEAIRIAREAGERLLLVGPTSRYLPWSVSYFEREVRPHVDGDRVTWIESLPNEEAILAMGRAKAFLFPLQWDEPFGLTVVESMAAGTAVVAYRRGSMPEMIRDGETGFLVDTEEEMVAALRRVPTLDRRRCRAWALSEFGVKRMLDGYEEVFRRVAAKG
jgi:glycosyltransferase involved in cell wall biosynthesis